MSNGTRLKESVSFDCHEDVTNNRIDLHRCLSIQYECLSMFIFKVNCDSLITEVNVVPILIVS